MRCTASFSNSRYFIRRQTCKTTKLAVTKEDNMSRPNSLDIKLGTRLRLINKQVTLHTNVMKRQQKNLLFRCLGVLTEIFIHTV